VIPVVMPKAGQSVEEATIVAWRVEPGAVINEGDVIFEIETDKATMDVEATDSGRLARIVAGEGDVVRVLEPVAYLANNDADVDAYLASQETAEQTQTPVVEERSEQQAQQEAVAERPAPPISRQGRIKASPAARKRAKDAGLADYSLVKEFRYVGDCYYPDPLGLCCREEGRSECIKVIMDYLRHVKDWDVFHLCWLLNDEALDWQDYGAVVKELSVAPFIILPETFQDYLSEFKKKINFIVRKVKKFNKLNGHYHFTQSGEKCKELLSWLFHLHSQRSLEKGRSTIPC